MLQMLKVASDKIKSCIGGSYIALKLLWTIISKSSIILRRSLNVKLLPNKYLKKTLANNVILSSLCLMEANIAYIYKRSK